MNLTTSVLDAIHERFRQAFGEHFQTNVDLGRYTSARVGGPAEMFLAVHKASELQAAVELAYAQSIPYFILGGGSNILVSDKGVRGLVIFNRAREVKFRSNGINVICTAESGANLSSLARQCIAKGLGGLEWAVNIPGWFATRGGPAIQRSEGRRSLTQKRAGAACGWGNKDSIRGKKGTTPAEPE